MKKMRLVPKMLVLAAAIMTATNPVYAKDTLQEQFSSPPDTSKPRAWWHWINGNITANGVEKDLLWMKQVPSHAVPARAVSLENLPPTWIGVGSIDLFFLEDKLFAERLVKSGVPTEFVIIEGAYHGFDVVDPSSPPARRFEKSMLDALRKA